MNTKYIVALTKGDDKKILGTFDTKQKADDFGKSQRIPRCDGMVYCYAATFDDEGNQCGASEKFYGVYN